MKTKKSFLVKDGLKRAFQTTVGLSLLLAACIITGCSSTSGGGSSGSSSGGGTSPGTLTITGIPAEYEGKFASFSSEMGKLLPGQNKPIIIASAEKPSDQHPATGTVIRNGEVTLLLYTKASFGASMNPFGNKSPPYTGSDTVEVLLLLEDKAEKALNDQGPDAIFASVTFENGVADVKWEDASKIGSIIITGSSPEYNGYWTRIDFKSDATGGLEKVLKNGPTVENGTITVKMMTMDGSGKNTVIAYTENSTMDITLYLNRPNTTIQIPATFLFKAARITGGKATLNFAAGVKQK
jgi:hypothetical protein